MILNIPYEKKIRSDFYNWALEIIQESSNTVKNNPGRVKIKHLLEIIKYCNIKNKNYS